MTAVEIIILIAGFLCVCISFFVAGKQGGEEEEKTEKDGISSDVWTEKDERIIRERVSEILEDRQTELVEETENSLNRICNEKIMAIDEFSRQLMEKIDNNHQEVVFMYNMLNAKEKDLKDIMQKPLPVTEPEKAPLKESESGEKPKKKEAPVQNREKKKAVTPEPSFSEERKTSQANVPGNVNLQIQKMYKEGKSILEISKALDIGQGEVKLVIALYGGKVR